MVSNPTSCGMKTRAAGLCFPDYTTHSDVFYEIYMEAICLNLRNVANNSAVLGQDKI